MPQHSRFANCNMHSRMHLHAQRLPCMASHALLWQPWSRLLWCMDAPYDSAKDSARQRENLQGLSFTQCNMRFAPSTHRLGLVNSCKEPVRVRVICRTCLQPLPPRMPRTRAAPPSQARAAGGSAARQRAPAAAASPPGCVLSGRLTERLRERQCQKRRPRPPRAPRPHTPGLMIRSVMSSQSRSRIISSNADAVALCLAMTLASKLLDDLRHTPCQGLAVSGLEPHVPLGACA